MEHQSLLLTSATDEKPHKSDTSAAARSYIMHRQHTDSEKAPQNIHSGVKRERQRRGVHTGIHCASSRRVFLLAGHGREHALRVVEVMAQNRGNPPGKKSLSSDVSTYRICIEPCILCSYGGTVGYHHTETTWVILWVVGFFPPIPSHPNCPSNLFHSWSRFQWWPPISHALSRHWWGLG